VIPQQSLRIRAPPHEWRPDSIPMGVSMNSNVVAEDKALVSLDIECCSISSFAR
jgi:hypothetical protein